MPPRRPVLPRVHIGCSGWLYKAWRGTFYPRGLATSEWLPWYAARFGTVELNNSFYRLPERATFASWAARTPPTFRFAVKASRYLTHFKRLRDPAEPIARLFGRVIGLGKRVGPVLYQLPPTQTRDVGLLDAFLAQLPRSSADLAQRGRARAPRVRFHHVMEFRHPSWYAPDVFDCLDRRHVSLCMHDRAGARIRERPIGPIAYARFHGTSGQYRGSYRRRDLEPWADWAADAARGGRAVYAYFNNDPAAAAPRNAMLFRTLVDERLG